MAGARVLAYPAEDGREGGRGLRGGAQRGPVLGALGLPLVVGGLLAVVELRFPLAGQREGTTSSHLQQDMACTFRGSVEKILGFVLVFIGANFGLNAYVFILI